MVSYSEIKKTALEVFGIDTIFPYQWLVISNILDIEARYEGRFEAEKSLEAEQQEDDILNKQIVLFPTGAGKSLCFQLPSLFLKKPMRDQEKKLKDKVNTVIFIGGQTKQERDEAYKSLKTANIIIANPEVLANKEVLKKVKERGVSHIAIDEAHCVTEWGETFRSQYLSVASIIKELTPTIVTAFTATASPLVLERMKKIIFEGVVFCSSRKKTESFSRLIQNTFNNLEVKFYHAGLEKKEKEEVEAWFDSAKDAVLVATCAWGMGVDKKDVRTVLHLDAPTTIEAYIQEAGRGGRDRKPSRAVLLWASEDKKRFSLLSEKEKERADVIISYAESGVCRREVLLRALTLDQNEEFPICEFCDICSGSAKTYPIEIEAIINYIKNRKIKRATLIENIESLNRYWNLQYANDFVFYLEKNKILINAGFLWRGKLKKNKLLTLK